MLNVSDLHAGYGQSEVLHGLNFNVAPGEIVVFVGRNGMGKTTLMKSLIGMVPVRAGSIMLDGTDLAHVARATSASPRARLRAAGPDDLLHHDRAGEHRDRPVRPLAASRFHLISTSCFPCCRKCGHGAAAIFRAASSSSSRSPARWRPTRKCCCWTSRPRASSPRSFLNSRARLSAFATSVD